MSKYSVVGLGVVWMWSYFRTFEKPLSRAREAVSCVYDFICVRCYFILYVCGGGVSRTAHRAPPERDLAHEHAPGPARTRER